MADMGYYFAKDGHASSILGHECPNEYLGRVGELFPGAERDGTNVRQFHRSAVLQAGDRQDLYYGWAFHSAERPASDGVHCPVNFLWQDPSMTGDTYHWYILMDIHEPEKCLEAHEVYLNGLAVGHSGQRVSGRSS